MSNYQQVTFLRILLFGGLLLTHSCKTPQKSVSDTTLSADKYAEHVRSTGFQSPEMERRGFRLPPGFEITLFASEPDISKPMNIEFDHRGRLWVTQSTEYPLAADPGNGNDKITILEDTNGDGKADTFTEFKSDLNIPIGIMPMADGAIAYSIPNVYYFRDTDGDGKADTEQKLLGPFGFNDTHGMVNNFIRGWDGWVHASHGFSNTSQVAGTDGDSLRMSSGNTFRFRTDGSRAEQTTFGRVNPFGFSYDERGYLYSVDCHSKPIYQLIPDADYPHFGKRATGIGFGPEMTSYELGSTALAGLVYYTGQQFPEAYRNNFFIGDVVTSRISRNSVSFEGSTPVSRFEENFLLSDDPWFRPVDIKVGPDGALYVADFYNRIIGHYEVDLHHPGRDRVSGRIWRITYKGNKSGQPALKDGASLDELIAQLNTPQLTIRMRTADRIYDTYGSQSVPPLLQVLENSQSDWRSQVQALWLLHRLGALPAELHANYLNSKDETVRIHALRILAQQPTLSEASRQLVLEALRAPSPFIQRTAAEALHRFPDFRNLQPLLDLYEKVPEQDSHLRYTVLLALRYNLKSPEVLSEALSARWSTEARQLLSKTVLDLPSKPAAFFAYDYLLTGKLTASEAIPYLEYVARYVHPAQIDGLLKRIQKAYAATPLQLMEQYQALSRGMTQSGRAPTPQLKQREQQAAYTIITHYAEKPFAALHAGSATEKTNFEQAAAIAGTYKMVSLEQALQRVLPDGAPLELQRAAVNALVKLSPTAYSPVFRQLFTDIRTYPIYKEHLAGALGGDPSAINLKTLQDGLPAASRQLQTAIAQALVKSTAGVGYLLESIEKEEAPAGLLTVTAIRQQADHHATAAQQEVITKLLAKGADSEKELEALVNQRTAGVQAYRGNLARGKEVFTANCAACHQVKGAGGLVGPQLDGIGNWGAHALTEKILAPNRNVTEAFRTYSITLTTNEQKMGLYRRTEGETMVFADFAGQEFSLPKSSIKAYKAVSTTIMPDQFRYIIPEKDFNELVNYLLSVK